MNEPRSTSRPDGQCIGDDELLLLGDEQVGAARAAELHAHLRECASCRRRQGALAKLTARLAPPPRTGGGERDAFVAQTMALIDADERARAAAAQRGWWRRPAGLASLGAGLAAAIAGVVAIVWLGVGRDGEAPGRAAPGALFPEHQRGVLTPRGDKNDALWRRARADAQLVEGARRRELASGARVGARAGLGVACTNLGAEPLYLLAFGVDAAGEVHWLFPAYRSATEDPPAVVVRAGAREEALPEVFRPELRAASELRVVTVLSRTRRTVKAVEARLQGRRARDAVADVFAPDDVVREWLVHVDAPEAPR